MLKWILIGAGGLAALVLLIALIGALLPAGHRASRRVNLPASPERVFEVITDVGRYAEWRPDVKRVEVLPDSSGGLRFREQGAHGEVLYRVEESVPPRRWVTRIDDPSLPYGGSWTYQLAPEAGGTALTITEDGEVKNPIFRFLSRTVFSTSATIEKYQAAVRERLRAK